MVSFCVVSCCGTRQLGHRSALRAVYLDDLLRLLRRRIEASTDIDVDVIAGIHHIGIHCAVLVNRFGEVKVNARGGEFGSLLGGRTASRGPSGGRH